MAAMDLQAVGQVLLHLLDTYDECRVTSSSTHAKKVLRDIKLGSDEEDVVLQFFVGLVRRQPVLDAVIPLFCGTMSEKEKTKPPSWNSLKVALYLSLFELNRRLTWEQFARLVATLPSGEQLAKFIEFYSNPSTLEHDIQHAWLAILDDGFVTNNLLEPVRGHLPQLQTLAQELAKANAKSKPEVVKAKKPTVPKPFNLTEPPPPKPEVAEQPTCPSPPKARIRPLPQTTYEKPYFEQTLRMIHDKHKTEAEVLLEKVKSFNPGYQRPSKSEKTTRKLAEMMEDEERELKFHKYKAHDVPPNLRTTVAPIKKTTAAILREGATVQKKLQDEIKRIDDLSRGAIDNSHYENWQREVRRQQVEERVKQQEERRWQVRLAPEDAKIARQKQLDANRLRAEQLKLESKEKMKEYSQEKVKKDQHVKLIVEDVVQGQGRVKESIKKLNNHKRNLAKEVQAELRELAQKALDEAEQELHKKATIAQEIRALQSVPALMEKATLDTTTTCGEGFLEEMSLAELQERLVLLKSWEKEAEEMKRQEILASKKRKASFVKQTAEAVKKQREQEEMVKLMKKREQDELHKLEMEAIEKVRTENEKIQQLKKKLAEKKTQNKVVRFSSAINRKVAQRKQAAQKLEQLTVARQDLMKLVS